MSPQNNIHFHCSYLIYNYFCMKTTAIVSHSLTAKDQRVSVWSRQKSLFSNSSRFYFFCVNVWSSAQKKHLLQERTIIINNRNYCNCSWRWCNRPGNIQPGFFFFLFLFSYLSKIQCNYSQRNNNSQKDPCFLSVIIGKLPLTALLWWRRLTGWKQSPSHTATPESSAIRTSVDQCRRKKEGVNWWKTWKDSVIISAGKHTDLVVERKSF